METKIDTKVERRFRLPAAGIVPAGRPRRAILGSFALFAATLLALLFFAASSSAAPPELWSACNAKALEAEDGSPIPPAPVGQRCSIPRGIAAYPSNGRLFVADQENDRVDELNARGEFLRAWGWGVVASGPDDEPRNEIQTVTVEATAGSFKLALNSFLSSTPAIPFDASASTLQAALSELKGENEQQELTPGDVAVSGPPGGPWTIEFVGGRTDTDMRQLQVRESTLSGGAATAIVATAQQGAAFERCIPAEGDVCRNGQRGSQSGQLAGPEGIAVDSAGGVYVVDIDNHRVQKFDRNGHFLLMFGGDVNKTKVDEGGKSEAERNLCTAASGNLCQTGTEGTGNGQFGEWPVASFIAVGPGGKIYVGDQKRIQVFDTGGHYLEDVPLDPEGELKDRTVTGLAVDGQGDLYVIYANRPDARKIVLASGKELAAPRFSIPAPDQYTHPVPIAIAVGGDGQVYLSSNAFFGNGSKPLDRIFQFKPGGELVDSFGKERFGQPGSTGLATNLCPGSAAPGNLYVANSEESNPFVRAYGTAPDGCFKAKTLPADPVGELTATLNGTVNPKGEAVEECFFQWGSTADYGNTSPCDLSSAQIGSGTEPVAVKTVLTGLTRASTYHFRIIVKAAGEAEPGADQSFKTLGPPVISQAHVQSAADTEASLRALVNPEGLATSCHVEYATLAAFQASGFTGAQSTPARDIGADRSDHLLAVGLTGLVPATAYRWRVLCINSSDTTASADLPLSTFPALVSPLSDCPNQALRGGLAALLPDCRAYEMVSPLDKNGGDILLQGFGNVQASPDGDRILYSAMSSFGDTQSAWAANEYLAGRGADGWSNSAIHPPVIGREAKSVSSGFGLRKDLLAVSTDLCGAWFWDYQNPPAVAGEHVDHENLIRRDNCGPDAGSLEALFPEPPPFPQNVPGPFSYAAFVRVGQEAMGGLSEDGAHAFFASDEPLLPDCRTTTNAQTISFQWLRNGVPIPGDTGPVHYPVAADAGTALQCQVLAAKETSGSLAVSNPATVFPSDPHTEIHPPIAPASIAAPTTNATLTTPGPGGQTLTCDPGASEWEGSPTFTYAWYRNGVPLGGATASTYVTTAADLASRAVFQCAVTGQNADGAVTEASFHRATSPAPAPAAPGGNTTTSAAVAITDRQTQGSAPGRVYEHSGGVLHLVSVLPGGLIGADGAVVGSGWSHGLENAVSADGSRVYWTIGPSARHLGTGTIYLRLHPEQGIVADECATPAAACTIPVSPGGLGHSAFFWLASRDGSKAFYSEGSLQDATAELFEFDLNVGGEPQTRPVAGGLEGVVGASNDLSHIYFVSREVLAGAAEAGAPNLYLDQEGVISFVARLAEGDISDVGGKEPAIYNLVSSGSDASEGEGQARHAERVSADGSTLLFQSRASLTSYDNTDAANGHSDVEVYRYQAGGEPLCISCNPSGARPRGRELFRPSWKGQSGDGGNVFAAAWIPGHESPLHASSPLSADGQRIFFNSNDALLPRDTNAAMDVYEWEAPGEGSCTTESSSYFAQNGGCLYLISTGESPFDSEFWEADADGSDVFFTTESSLVGKDPGLVDLYDARVEGGFPEPTVSAACEGEACQSPPAPPDDPTPASSSFEGAGNLTEPPAAKCSKGNVRRHGRCVRKHGKAHKRHAKSKRGARG